VSTTSSPSLEERVLNGLRDILLGNEALIDEFAAEFKRELTRLRKEGQGANRRLLQQIERGVKRCLDFITGGDGDPGSVRDQLRRLEARKREIEVDLKAKQGDTDIATCPTSTEEKSPAFSKLWLTRRHALRPIQTRSCGRSGPSASFGGRGTRPGHVDTIRSLIDRIDDLPGPMRGRCRSSLSAHWLKLLHCATKNDRRLLGRRRQKWLRGLATTYTELASA
jgi:hypothetical protein